MSIEQGTRVGAPDGPPGPTMRFVAGGSDAKKRRGDHVGWKPPGIFVCMRCGASYAPTLPAPIDVLAGIGKAFTKSHRGCKLDKARGLACTHCMGFGHAPDACPQVNYCADPKAWWNGPDTGLSSKTMWLVMMGAPRAHHGDHHPWDPADLGRCLRLLAAFPAWRDRLGLMREVSPVWARLVDAWDELEALYAEERPSGMAPKLYAKMTALIETGRRPMAARKEGT